MIVGEGEKNAAFRTRRGAFLTLCRTAINPAVTPDDVDEMHIQHILTEEIFISIFSDTQTLEENSVARESLRLSEDGLPAAYSLMPIERRRPKNDGFNPAASLPFELRIEDFSLAMQDVYDFFFDVNSFLVAKGLERLDDMLRPAIMSGLLSDLLAASIAKHSRTLTGNQHFNGHPDLLVKGVYPNDGEGRHGGRRDQDDTQGGWRGRYSRRTRAVDGRFRLRSGRPN